MGGLPMEVAVALSLIVASVNTKESGWFGKMFTFESTPQLIQVLHDKDVDPTELVDLGSLVARVKDMGWGGSTNIEATMDLIIEHAQQHRTTAADLAKQRLIIFSDMEFDDSYGGGNISPDERALRWNTTHDRITNKFRNAGYGSMPVIVYWNIRASVSTPVQEIRPGVIMLAGFSAGLLNAFMSGNMADSTAMDQIHSVLEKPVYENLVVADTDLGQRGAATVLPTF
jgi:hypothetical protein